jgi:hypothetical protein
VSDIIGKCLRGGKAYLGRWGVWFGDGLWAIIGNKGCLKILVSQKLRFQAAFFLK